jgi:hypothetical protein
MERLSLWGLKGWIIRGLPESSDWQGPARGQRE